MPPDELLRYGRELGLELPDGAAPSEAARRIRLRQALLIELERDALLDVIVWARRPVRRSAGKEEIARQIAAVQRTNYEELSPRGLAALARLREIDVKTTDDAPTLVERLRRHDGFWKRVASKRRQIVGSFVGKLLHEPQQGEAPPYRFLPENPALPADTARESLKNQIEEHGVVGGLAQRLRGAADDYIKTKLDEIEHRIDWKLDEIDARLSEWRDREVANRLKILKITLVFTVLVALLSLGYNCLKTRSIGEPETSLKQTAVETAVPDER